MPRFLFLEAGFLMWDVPMTKKPTYEELKQTVKDLEKKAGMCQNDAKGVQHQSLVQENIFQAIGQSALILNTNHEILAANSATTRITDRPEKDLIGKKCYALFHNADQPPENCPLMKMLISGQIETEEMEVQAFDRSFLVSCTPVFSKSEEISTIIHIATDITERKQAEAEIRAAREYAQNIINSSLDMIISVDNDRRIVEFNRAAEKTFGYRKEDVLGQKVHMLYADFQEGESVHKTIRQTGKFVDEVMNVRKDGGTFRSLLSSTPLRDTRGNLIGNMGVSRDIEEKKQTEKAQLKLAQDLKRRVKELNCLYGISKLRESPEISFEETFQGIVDLIPPAWQHPEHTCSRIILEDEEYKTENFKKTPWKQTSKIFVHGESVGSVEVYYLEDKLQKDQEPFLQQEKKLIHAIAERLGRIIERQRTEEEKAKLEIRLRQAQKMEAIATLAGGIAHQFNNALYGITGNIDLLEMAVPDAAQIKEYVNPMKDSAQRMANLTNQLLAYARGGKYRSTTIAINQFLSDTLPILSHIIGAGIRVETDLCADMLHVEADLTQIQMVLSAILINASEAIEAQGCIQITTGLLMADTEFVKHHPGLKPGPYVCLTIADNGKGMDQEIKSKIFEPFFTTKFPGRGLGMASAYGIVKNHDGWISVASELDVGTQIQIYLPIIDVPIKSEQTPKIEPRKGTGTILLIEDEEIIVNVVQAMLKRLGYHVLVARNGTEAVDIIKTFDKDIDLALLDIKLPDMNGSEVYSVIKDIRPDSKVIVCSGYSIDGPAQEILNAGAHDFIKKPFSFEILSKKLSDALKPK